MKTDLQRSRERFWQNEWYNIPNKFWLTMECEWVPDGEEPSLDEEVRRSYEGWRLNGLKGMRHWLRDRIAIVDLFATG